MSESTASAQAGSANSTTEDTESLNGSNPEDEDAGTKRVNITINSDRHETLSEFAEERGFSFSAFVRRGAEELRHRLEEDGTERELQPILGELDRQQETLADHGEQLDELVDTYKQLLTLVRHGQAGSGRGDEPLEEVKRHVESLLHDEEPLTIPDMCRETPYNRRRIQVAVGQLQDEFVVTSTESDDGTTEWRCR